MIGRVNIPASFYAQMRNARLYFVEMSVEERTERLVNEYGRFHEAELTDAIQRIAKRIGPQHCKAALVALAQGNLHEVARITLRYYDKSYLYGASKREPQRIVRLHVNGGDLEDLALRLIHLI